MQFYPTDVGVYAVDAGYHQNYVICGANLGPEEPGPIKIGISDDVRQRFNGLQSASWEPLQCYAYWWAPNRKRALELEKAVHQKLSTQRLRGEWFEVTPHRAKTATLFVAEDLGIRLVDVNFMEMCTAEFKAETVEAAKRLRWSFAKRYPEAVGQDYRGQRARQNFRLVMRDLAHEWRVAKGY